MKMKKIISDIKYKFLMLFMPKSSATRPTSTATPKDAKSFYDFKLTSIEGKPIDFSAYNGKKVLIVNIASQCGFTPQYAELEELYQTYKGKLEIIGFPANDFLGQEPGSDSEIATFCQRNFGVSFQLFQKSSVIKGKEQNPLYNWLSSKEQNGWNSKVPTWNFCKYLINEKGELVHFYNSSVKPMSAEILKEI
jgi:glutathione peroxidase